MKETPCGLIGQTDALVLGGSEKGLKTALSLAKRGRNVTLLCEETCLCEDICGTNRYPDTTLTPDVYQRNWESICENAGIRVLYFLKYVDARTEGAHTFVRVAAKGGLFEICCRALFDCRVSLLDEHYIAITTSRGLPGFSLLEARGAATGTIAQNLYACRKALLEKFIEQKRQNPDLMLGRMARRGFSDSEAASPTPAPAVEQWDLIVAGGGTAGVMAALHAARGGLKTLLIEPNYDLGGTQTVGGVSTYWFGRRYSAVQEIDEASDRLCEACGIHRRYAIWSENDDFHAGIRSFVYLEKCLEAGVEILFGQLAYDAVTEETAAGAVVKGIRSAGAAGNRVDYAKAVIDATGDGDIAVRAGADFCYGSRGDAITSWGSLAQYTSPDDYVNNFSSMVCADDPLDYSRFVRLGKKRGDNTFDHGSYVSLRESRHIRGTKTVTLRDLASFRTWEDGLYTCWSNYDIKGKLDADLIYCGVLPPPVAIQIPLGALLPVDRRGRRIENLYVAGKAISATHNAFPSIRMQPDLMHQGAVLGGLLAHTRKLGTLPEALSPAALREFLLGYTSDPLTLPCALQDADACARRITADSRTHWVDVPYSYEETAPSPVLGLYLAEAGDAVPAIRRRLSQERDPALRQRFIGAALWHGADDWTEELCDAVCDALGDVKTADALPRRQGSVLNVNLLPDHGVMPELVYQLNQLGWSRKDSVLRPFRLVLEALEQGPRDYRDARRGIYTYIEAFPYAAMHNPQPDFIPMLKRLLRLPELQDCVPAGDPIELMTERLQILVFLLCRALAFLGDAEGYAGLHALQNVESAAIRRSATLTLQRFPENGRGIPPEGIWEKIW